MPETESMSISVNGKSRVPPGFRFHPTEEELLHYYLRKKVSSEKIDLDVIRDVDLNKLEPWDIQEKCKIGSTPQSDWYFFSHKDKKYPTGTRTNRATAAGFWKATGRDKTIYGNCTRIGMRKTLVFYKGRAPHGLKSDWIMHEYRLEESPANQNNCVPNVMGELANQEESWVVCRIFKKKDHHKTLGGSSSPTIINGNRMFMINSSSPSSCNEGSLEQILQHVHDMGADGTCKQEIDNQANKFMNNNNIDHNLKLYRAIATGGFNNINMNYNDTFLKLPSLESPRSTTSPDSYYHYPMVTEYETAAGGSAFSNFAAAAESSPGHVTSWAALDRLVASQLNGQSHGETNCFCEPAAIALPYCCNTMSPGDDDDRHQQQHQQHDFQLPTLRSISSNRSSEDYNSEQIDLWSFTRSSPSLSSSDPLCHVANSSL